MKKIYVGCALVNTPEAFIQEINQFKEALRKEGYEVLEFMGAKGSVEEVVINDAQCVETSDLFVAVATYPSTGLGYELGVAEFNQKQVIAVAKKGERVSRLVQGLAVRNPKLTFVWYESLSEIIPLVKARLG